MAVNETNVTHDIMKSVSPSGTRLFKNVRGSFYTMDSVRMLISAISSMNGVMIKTAVRNLRQLAAGLLVPGASDLVGFKPVIITQDMVGMKFARFAVIECKTATGRVAPEQKHFINVVKENGGLAGVAWSAEDARKILEIYG